MKVYQCFHKYPPHIPQFEKENNIEELDPGFNELRELLIKDGYASTYLLKPALEGKHDEVFYTLWDYERLQFKWAEEHGLHTRNLDEIKLAQIEAFKPDVFYNHSPRYDNNFIRNLSSIKNLKKVCWDAIITDYPWLHEEYDLRLTLFKPYVNYWNQKGLHASLLTPSYSPFWSQFIRDKREIDVLFYGQYSDFFFSARNRFVVKLLEWKNANKYNVRIHLQRHKMLQSLIDIKHLSKLTRFIARTPLLIKKHSLTPIYGSELYKAIGNSKIIVNAFTNYNGLFKDNMRNYEAVGLGALMIGEDGIYPDFLEPDLDFLTYKTADELIEKIEYALSMPDQGREMANRAHEKLVKHCSKEKQWEIFYKLIKTL